MKNNLIRPISMLLLAKASNFSYQVLAWLKFENKMKTYTNSYIPKMTITKALYFTVLL